MAKEIALNWIDENSERIVELSDRIWELAEVGLLEYETSRLLADELERCGFEIERGVANMPTAFIATWGRGHPTIGVLGELDALPGLSQKLIPRREPMKEGSAGHGCGHNIFAVSGMAGTIAAKVEMEKKGIPGTVKFYGCPAEETLVGKVWLVRDGYFSDVDAVLGHHPGTVNTAGLTSTNAMNSAKFHFYGTAAHAASSPDQGRSALDAAELMNVGINYMREHIAQDARIHYVIEEGGHEPNVVPAYARSWYYVRAPERGQVEQIYDWVLRVADAADIMARTTHRVEFLTGCHNIIPNRTLSEVVVSNMRMVGAPRHTKDDVDFAAELSKSITPEQKMSTLTRFKRPGWEKLLNDFFDERVLDAWNEGMMMSGSTDIGDISWVTPTMEFETACCVLGTPAHSWQFAAQAGMSIGHKSLIYASKVNATSTLDLMTKPETLEKAWRELKQRLNGRIYKSPIPADLKPPIHQLQGR